MKTLLNLICLILCVGYANAQTEDHKIVAGLHAGYSLTGNLVKNIANSDPLSNVSATSIPALQLTFDYSLSNLLSIGIAASYQSVSINAENYTFIDNDGNERTETFSTSFRRSQIAVRPLFHYGNAENLDMYSGFRIGILTRGFSDFKGDNSDDLDETVFEEATSILSGARFSGSLTAFGMRYYFTENIGAGLEVNLGAPYIVNAGVSARF